MSFIQDLADYVAANTSLIVDTDLYIAEEAVDSPDECVTLVTSPGSSRTESGIDVQALQVLANGKSFIAAEDLAQTVHDLLANKPGFNGLEGIFYCEVINSPFPAGRDGRGRYVFSSNFVIRKK
jgi:hypothetical protein